MAREVRGTAETRLVQADLPKVHLRHGIETWKAGRVAESLGHFRLARTMGARHPHLHYWLALALQALGRRGDAERETRALLDRDPRDVLGLVMRDRLAAEAAKTAPKAPRIAFHMNRPFHSPIFKPLFALLAAEHRVLLTFEPGELVPFAPQVVVICDAQGANVRKLLPGATVVNVMHGVSPGKSLTKSADPEDYYCIASEAVAERFLAAGRVPAEHLWITGHLETDALFRPDAATLPINLEPGRKVVLYAPTFNPGMSSVPVLRERMGALMRGARDDVTIITRPHPDIIERKPDWLAWFRAAAGDDPHFHLMEDFSTTLAPYMLAADVMVSDASNAAFQFLALDRPIVLIDNLDAELAGGAHEPDSLEWTWRDMGDDVSDVSKLAAAIDRSLKRPRRGARKRRSYAKKLFGKFTDGKAAERIAARIQAL